VGEVLPTAEICGNDKDENCDGQVDEGCAVCEISMSVSPSQVWPQIPASQRPVGYKEDWAKADVVVTLTNPAPPEGCTISLKVEPVENSGGHGHNSSRPKGTVTPETLTIPGETIGAVSAIYKSSEIGGEEKIIAEVKGEKKNEATIQVNVPGLAPLAGGSNLITWTSTEKYHKLADSNYGTSSTISTIFHAVNQYVQDYFLLPFYGANLAVVDMSLPQGGLFDVNGNWSPSHTWHRLGKSVDFSKYYRDRNGRVVDIDIYRDDKVVGRTTLIDQEKLDEYFRKQQCARWERGIGKIHYECKK
jgi:hypothetical protein